MSGTALVLIDIQNDYFPGGRMALHGACPKVLATEEFLKTPAESA